MMRRQWFFLFLLPAVFLVSCGRKSSHSLHSPDRPPSFQPLSASEADRVAEVLSGVTEGALPRTGPVTIHFKYPQVASDEVGSEASSDWVSFDPKLDGRLFWKDPQTLLFQPKAALPPAHYYVGHLKLEKVLGEKGWPEVPFTFYGIPTRWFIEPDGLIDGPEIRFTFNLRVNPAPDSESVARALSAEQGGEHLRVGCGSGAAEGDAVVLNCTVYNVKRSLNKSLYVRVSGVEMGALADGEEEINLPLREQFGILGVIPWGSGKDRGFKVVFSEALTGQSDAASFVSMDGQVVPVRVQGSHLTVTGDLKVGAMHTLVIRQGISAMSGLRLMKDFRYSQYFEDEKPFVRLPQRGYIVPTSGSVRMAFESMNYGSVRVRLVRIRPERAAPYIENSGEGDSYIPGDAEVVTERVYQTGARRNQLHHGELDMGGIVKKLGLGIYGLEISGAHENMLYPCDAAEHARVGHDEGDPETRWPYDHPCNEYYTSRYNYDSHVSPRRTVVVSDLMLLAGMDPSGNLSVHAIDLVEGRPWKGAHVTVSGTGGGPLKDGKTDGEGALMFEGVNGAILLSAEADKDGGTHRAWLRLGEGEARNLSRFDVQGEDTPRGLRLFTYSDRGVYRPGDSLVIGCILRDENHQPFPRLPVRLSLVDPAGRIAAQTVFRNAPDAHYQWRTATRSEDATGQWHLTAEAGPAKSDRIFSVETVRPNRLKIQMDLPQDQINSDQLGRDLHFSARWLMGSPAANYKTHVSLAVTVVPVSFRTYRDFSFNDPTHAAWEHRDENLFSGDLDADGRANFSSGLSSLENPPGMLRAEWRTQVFEPGGQPSMDTRTVAVSPYSHYAGIKLEGLSEWGSVETDKPLKVELASLDEQGHAASRRSMTVQIWNNPNWWWYEGAGSERFQERSESKLVATLTGASGDKLSFTPQASGRYFFLASDDETKHAAGLFADAWSWDGGGSEGPAPSLLRLTSEKDTVEPGGTIAIRFPAPEKGRALIRLLHGRSLIREEWVETHGGTQKWQTRVEAGFAPNVFVEVDLFQPWSRENDRPVRMYGLVPIIVMDPESHLRISLESSSELKPESNADVVIRNPDGRKGSVVLAAVDEGLLDLTHFRTPDPHASLYAREGLSVRTWDVFDRVLGAYAGRFDQILTLGGDRVDLDKLGKKKGMEFPPMVWVSPPISLGGKKSINVQVPIPAYAGSVRLMAVASSGSAVGSAEKTVPVRAPLMIYGTVPRALSPGDRCDLPATVFAFRSGDANISLHVQGPVQSQGATSMTTHFSDKGGDFLAAFSVIAGNMPGVARADFTASGSMGNARQSLPFEVHWPEPPRPKAETYMLGSEPLKIAFTPFGLPGTRQARLEAGTVSLGLDRRIDDLLQYPYGCVEQTVSTAFPQLVLAKLFPGLSNERKEQAHSHVQSAIESLRRFQTAGGAFSLWAGEGVPHEWGTLWAARFLQEAKRAGYLVPDALTLPLLQHLSTAAREFRPGVYARSSDTLMQSMRLFWLAGEGKPDWGAMNLLRESRLPGVSCWTLARAYRAAGQEGAARTLAGRCSDQVRKDRDMYYEFGSPHRDQAFILSAKSELGFREDAQHLFSALKKDFAASEWWYSTQEAAATLVAFSDFLGSNGGENKPFDLRWRMNGGAWKQLSSQGETVRTALPANDAGTLEVERVGGGTVDLQIVSTGVQPEKAAKSSGGLALDVQWQDASGRLINPDKLPQGGEFVAVATVKNSNSFPLDNLALTLAFPGGWEIRNPRLQGAPGVDNLTTPEHLDVRDDRVHFHFRLERGKEARFAVGLTAAYKGEYYRPGAFVTAMYDASFSAYVPGGRAQVSGE